METIRQHVINLTEFDTEGFLRFLALVTIGAFRLEECFLFHHGGVLFGVVVFGDNDGAEVVVEINDGGGIWWLRLGACWRMHLRLGTSSSFEKKKNRREEVPSTVTTMGKDSKCLSGGGQIF